jgi:hypothetical protein
MAVPTEAALQGMVLLQALLLQQVLHQLLATATMSATGMPHRAGVLTSSSTVAVEGVQAMPAELVQMQQLQQRPLQLQRMGLGHGAGTPMAVLPYLEGPMAGAGTSAVHSQ